MGAKLEQEQGGRAGGAYETVGGPFQTSGIQGEWGHLTICRAKKMQESDVLGSLEGSNTSQTSSGNLLGS